MGYLLLVIVFLLIIVGEAFLDNFWWIGSLLILYSIYSIIRQIKEVKELGGNFDGAEIILLLFKVGLIVGSILLMVTI